MKINYQKNILTLENKIFEVLENYPVKVRNKLKSAVMFQAKHDLLPLETYYPLCGVDINSFEKCYILPFYEYLIKK
jgi:hypothetical protein